MFTRKNPVGTPVGRGIGNGFWGDRRDWACHSLLFSLQPNERKTIAIAIGYGFGILLLTGQSYLMLVPA